MFGTNSGTIKDVVLGSGSIKGGRYLGGICSSGSGRIINCGSEINVEGGDCVGRNLWW